MIQTVVLCIKTCLRWISLNMIYEDVEANTSHPSLQIQCPHRFWRKGSRVGSQTQGQQLRWSAHSLGHDKRDTQHTYWLSTKLIFSTNLFIHIDLLMSSICYKLSFVWEQLA